MLAKWGIVKCCKYNRSEDCDIAKDVRTHEMLMSILSKQND